MQTIGQISREEEKEMNNIINDPMMTPIVPFERQIFEMVDPEDGDLKSIDMVDTFLTFIREDHTVR